MSTLASWTLRDAHFEWGRTYLMGVLNVTPDSFSDGGEFNTPAAALAQAQQLVAAGADIIDLGGQSTRPGSVEISLEEELERVLSVLQIIRPEILVPISVDTTRAASGKDNAVKRAQISLMIFRLQPLTLICYLQ